MTVQELITELQKLPPHSEILVDVDSEYSGDLDIQRIDTVPELRIIVG